MCKLLSQYRAVARDLKVDAVAIVPGPNFTRLFGAEFHSHERPLVVFIPAEGDAAAIVPNLELRSFDLIGFEGEVFDWRDQDGYQHAFEALASQLPLSSLAVEGQIMRVFVHHAIAAAWPGLRIVDAEKQISGLRIIKSESEVSLLADAIHISERAMDHTISKVRVGMTETEIQGLLTQALFANGADAHAFGPIVAAGDNSAMPHAHARSDYRVQAGDALLLDFGARKDGFCADITRTFFVGHVDDASAEVYDAVYRANLRGHEVTKAGVTCHEVDDAVIGVLEASPFADRIRTKTGHGLGRDVHEAPYIMRGNHQVLEAGMVFTNEPGLYQIGEFGVRIEDDILVTDNGCRSLTQFPKELTVIGT